MESVLGVVAVVVVGLLVGVEFAVAVFVNPIFDRLPDNGGLNARTDGARVLGRIMPFWYIGSVVLAAVWAVVADHGERGSAAIGAALLVVSVLMSVTLLVPINNRAKQWTASTAPSDWKEQAHRWDRFHYVRVLVIIAAFAVLAAGLTH